MFYDEATLETERRRARRRIRPIVVILLVLPCAVAAGFASLLDMIYRPGALQPIIDHFTKGAPFRLAYDDLVLLPVGAPFDVFSWHLMLTGLAFDVKDPDKPDWRIERAVGNVPRFERRDGIWWILWDRLEVDGLIITAYQQRPPPPFPVPPRAPVLYTREAAFRGAGWSAPDDPPLQAAVAQDISGELDNVVYRTGPRTVDGTGTLRMPYFRTGNIEIEDMVLTDVVCEDANVTFDGEGRFAGQPVYVTGDVKTFHRKPDVDLTVRLEGAQLDDVISTATDRPSPVAGQVDLMMDVDAGGDRPRGGAVMNGALTLRNGRIQLPSSTSYVVRDLIRILPWVQLNAANQVELDVMTGRLMILRGVATFKEVTYPVGRRKLRLDGTVSGDDLYLVVRLLPPPERSHRPGLGVVIQGTPVPDRFRVATSADLLKPDPWVPFATEEEREDWEEAYRQEVARRRAERLSSGGP